MRRARSALIDEMRGERTLYFLIPKMNIHVSYPILIIGSWPIRSDPRPCEAEGYNFRYSPSG